MSGGTPARLVYMANQIAAFFGTQPGGNSALKVADHIKAFWTPSMIRTLQAYVADDSHGLGPLGMEALAVLKVAPAGAVRDALELAGERVAEAPGDDAG
jgi:formate dehydrogenase subunit delta